MTCELATDWGSIRRELLAMAEEDLRVRAALAGDGSLFQGYHPRMQAVHDSHAVRMATILTRHGWPGQPQVGRDGAEAAWLIAQHAIAHPALQRRALTALLAGAARGEVPALQAARTAAGEDSGSASGDGAECGASPDRPGRSAARDGDVAAQSGLAHVGVRNPTGGT
jgi:hypothetical protein